MLMLPINETFQYQFVAAGLQHRADGVCFCGHGEGQVDDEAFRRLARMKAARDAMPPEQRDRMALREQLMRARRNTTIVGDDDELKTGPLLGPRPAFELHAGWLTLLPSDGWIQPLPLHFVADHGVLLDAIRNEARNLKSFSLYVGTALQEAMQEGDVLKFSRNQLGDFAYCLERKSEAILCAGGMFNQAGPVALSQEYDVVPNQNPMAGQTLRELRFATHLSKVRSFVTVRIQDQVLQLQTGQDAYVEPYYVFLPRSNYDDSPMHGLFGCHSPAVYAVGALAGHTSTLTRELIRDAANLLLNPQAKIL